MRLNQNEEDLFKELENIEFDFSLGDDINGLNKIEKEKVLKALDYIEDTINNSESNDEKKEQSE